MCAPSLFSLFAPCPRGLETVLAEELNAIQQQLNLHFMIGETTPGGLHLEGDWNAIFAINLYSRIASRLLLKIAQAPYHNTDDLYQFALQQTWEHWFSHNQTFRIDITAIKSPLKSLDFGLLRVKDGICDRFRNLKGERPSISTEQPDIRISVFLNQTNAALYLDTSGDPLFKRGWRIEKGEAPIRENLAAGILRLSGWQPNMPLFDPMCGSGTFLIEAMQMALNIPAGISRRFGFEKFRQYNISQWQALKVQAREAKKTVQHAASLEIYGSDISSYILKKAQANFAQAGLPVLPLKQQDARTMHAPSSNPGILICNPPYGKRIEIKGKPDPNAFQRSESPLDDGFFEAMGNSLKNHFTDWQAFILSSDRQLPKHIRLRESGKTVLFNGALECRLFRFNLFAGSLKKPISADLT